MYVGYSSVPVKISTSREQASPTKHVNFTQVVIFTGKNESPFLPQEAALQGYKLPFDSKGLY